MIILKVSIAKSFIDKVTKAKASCYLTQDYGQNVSTES